MLTYLRGTGSSLGSLTVLSVLEQHVEFLNEKLLGSREVGSRGKLDGKVRVLERVTDVRDNVVLLNAY